MLEAIIILGYKIYIDKKYIREWMKHKPHH